MIKGYKGFYRKNGKLTCLDVTYEIGKTYATNKVKLCNFGIHYCEKLDDVLDYYDLNDELVICEVEDLGDLTIKNGNKSVTNKLKIIKEIKDFKSKLKNMKFDKNNNLIYKKDCNGNEWFYKYDKNNNKIYQKYYNGDEWFWKFDKNNNMTYKKDYSGDEFFYKYDKNNNKIYKKDCNGDEWYLIEE